MAATYNDNTVQYGARILTVSTVAFVADNYELTTPSTVIERTNSLGEPSGSVGIAGFVRGTATVQLATSTTTAPTLGATFVADSSTYYVTDVGAPESSQGEKKVNISFIKAYG
jgi:hypothetical protein